MPGGLADGASAWAAAAGTRAAVRTVRRIRSLRMSERVVGGQSTGPPAGWLPAAPPAASRASDPCGLAARGRTLTKPPAPPQGPAVCDTAIPPSMPVSPVGHIKNVVRSLPAPDGARQGSDGPH